MSLKPEQEQGQATPAAGGDTPANTPEPTTPAATEPFKAFTSKEEYEAHFGTRATESRVSLARKHGFESVEAMEAALADNKQRTDAEKTELQRKDDEIKRLQPLAAENLTLKQERAADRALLAAEVDPAKLDDVMTLLKAKGISLTEEGNVDRAALDTSISALLESHPYFKTGAKAASIGTGSNPAGGANLPTKNPWKKESRNLTEQAAIMQRDPALAGRMRKAAGL